MTAVERQVARLVGLATLLIGAAALSVVAANWQTRLHGGRDVSAMAPLAIALLLLGLGSLLGLRAALYLIAAAFAVAGAWLVYGTVREVPFPWMLFNLAIAALLLLPALVLVRLHRRNKREEPGNTPATQ